MTPNRRIAVGIVIATALLVAVTAAQTYVGARYAGVEPDAGRALAIAAAALIPWALLTPAILGLARRYPLSFGDRPANVAIHVAASLAITALKLFVEAWIDMRIHDAAASSSSLNGYLNYVVYWLITFAAHWGLAMARFRERELRTRELERQLAQARLRELEERLRPHFLFNALHAVSALMHEDVEAADEAIEKLGALLRRALDASSERSVSLREEIDFARSYLEIEQLRLGARLRVEWSVDPASNDALVPAFLLQPLVENAVRHGVATRLDGGCITVETKRAPEVVVIRIDNDGNGVAATAGTDGVGLATTRERLLRLYGERASLRLEELEHGGARVELELPA